MSTCILHLIKRFKRCNKGVTAIEFAFVAPALLLLVMGTLEVSLIMYAKSTMEGASFQTSRTGKTGYAATSKTQEQTILETLNQRVGMFLDTTKVTISSKSYSSFGNIAKPEPFVDSNGNGVRNSNENYTDVNGNGQYDTDMGATGYGSSSDITVYTMSYPWVIQTPLVGKFFNNGAVTITARSVVQNEPY